MYALTQMRRIHFIISGGSQLWGMKVGGSLCWFWRASLWLVHVCVTHFIAWNWYLGLGYDIFLGQWDARKHFLLLWMSALLLSPPAPWQLWNPSFVLELPARCDRAGCRSPALPLLSLAMPLLLCAACVCFPICFSVDKVPVFGINALAWAVERYL